MIGIIHPCRWASLWPWDSCLVRRSLSYTQMSLHPPVALHSKIFTPHLSHNRLLKHDVRH